MQQRKKKKAFAWLKNFDQIAVPVSMHYEGDSVKTTRIGGCVSIVGLMLVLAFLAGTLSMYFTFSDVKTNISTASIDPITTIDCTAPGNQCLKLNGASNSAYMPFVKLQNPE